MLKLKLQIRAIHPARDNGSVPVVVRILNDDKQTIADTVEFPIAFNPAAVATFQVGDVIEFDQVVAAK